MQNEIVLSYHRVRGLYFLVVTFATTILSYIHLFTVAGSTSCKNCKKGYHQSEKRKSTCDKCPENTFSAEEGASECTSVQEGYIAIVEGGENTGMFTRVY